ncbi:LppX_LprAFG lipoprotein [Mycobacterium sp. M1]|uniref:LppX_LprAFG lipoprotein n=2 Tax=Mycolicibacter acidiphilus TaxID=2835306 RepID=A0ABS5RF43_9MYCO|nr:LppX_LprAFG lipoprotein [Mycolicibacter acidiphilus]MBS9532208.1 LppX_LprAFG lipoprotein [Mycolicibacter acidiphilus]
MRRLLTALVATTAAATLFTGCSGKHSGGPLPEAAPLVKEASATTAGIKSAHLVLSVAGKIKGLPVKTLEGDLTTDPATAAKGTAKITLGGSDIEAKFVVLDGDLYAAMSGDDYLDIGAAKDVYDVGAILDPSRGLANLLDNLTDAKSVAHEKINGQDTVKITGETPADAVNKLASQLKASAPMPTTVWIVEGGNHDLVQAQLEPSAGNSITMTLSNPNVPVTVEKPAGV